jgi:hypothetical protein
MGQGGMAGLGPFLNDQTTAAARDGPGLGRGDRSRDQARHGGNCQYSLSDPRFLLRVLAQRTGDVRDPAPIVGRYAAELRDNGSHPTQAARLPEVMPSLGHDSATRGR